jgi:hypothetical protein
VVWAVGQPKGPFRTSAKSRPGIGGVPARSMNPGSASRGPTYIIVWPYPAELILTLARRMYFSLDFSLLPSQETWREDVGVVFMQLRDPSGEGLGQQLWVYVTALQGFYQLGPSQLTMAAIDS